MKKISYIFIPLLIIILLVITTKQEDKTFTIDGIKYAVSINGESSNSFPTDKSYNVELECQNANSSWNYEDWTLDLTNVTGDVSCNISFTSKDKTYLNSHIMSLGTSGIEQGTGKVVIENGYRYEGKNPNNYIKFNNELWRIIGVFDNTSHGVAGENLTKIIRNESLGGYVWNKTESSDWTTASLNYILNGPYYNYNAEGNDTIISNHCYSFGSTITSICNFGGTGINDQYRGMIKNVTWYLGTTTDTSNNVQTFYTNERSESTTTGYIGLMYPSDYGYSVISDSCSRNTNLGSYSTEACGGNSWLLKTTYEWTISYLSASSIRTLKEGAQIASDSITISSDTRPVLYLDSNVYIANGTGTITDPYIIHMN